MRTIGSVLDESRGIGPGFDFLRVGLAFSVVTWHTPSIASDTSFETTRFLWLFNYAILAMFFALSGFLISGSALRLGLKDFVINRGLRIVPALAVEIILSALILGPIFTILDVREYFGNGQTWRYFTNIAGLINYYLPGVFARNPSSIVNASLWTVPYEVGCYVIMSGLIVLGFLKRPSVILAAAVLFVAVGVGMTLAGYQGPPHGLAQLVSDRTFFDRGSGLFVGFLCGIAAYLYRYKLPYSWVWLGVALAFCAVVAGLGSQKYPVPLVSLVFMLPLTYIMAFVGVSKFPPLPFFHRGDYSYGIYLYGWPVMQAMRGWFPTAGQHATTLWLISVPAITLFAAFSWHVIEKPVLRIRKKFSFVARQRLEETPTAAQARQGGPVGGQSSAKRTA